MLYMNFQFRLERVPIHRILIGFEAMLEIATRTGSHFSEMLHKNLPHIQVRKGKKIFIYTWLTVML